MLDSLMYHYVIAPEDKFGDRKGCSTTEFEHHVASSASDFNVLDGQELSNLKICDQTPENRQMVFTFDDGLAEHYFNVAPILEKYGCKGFFFVPTEIFEGKLLKVHKLHIILSVFGSQTVQFLTAKLKKFDIPEPQISEDVVRKAYRWDVMEIARAKYILNYVIDHETSDQMLSQIVTDYIGSESEIAKEFYMSPDQMIELQSRGHVIGGHSHRHVPLTSLGPLAKEDISKCLNILNSYLGPTEFFSFPYGKKSTFNAQHITQLKSEGVKNVFTTEVGSGYLGQDRFALKRTDPKDHF